MKYRVMVTGYAGMPDWELGVYRWWFAAAVRAAIYNITNPHFMVAWVEEDESCRGQ